MDRVPSKMTEQSDENGDLTLENNIETFDRITVLKHDRTGLKTERRHSPRDLVPPLLGQPVVGMLMIEKTENVA